MNNNDRTLRSAAKKQNMVIGTAVQARRLKSDSRYRETIAKEFNSITAEYEMKFRFLQPERGRFDFSQSDALVNFASKNNMDLRGHTLVWHKEIPKWIENGNWSRRELLGILENHIKTVVGRYKGEIPVWDVVNEAVNEDGTLRNSFWLKEIGPEYIELAFKWAHEADPNATLIYNDYRNSEVNRKSNGIYRLVSDLKADGVPIDGVGFQMHMPEEDPRNFKSVADNMRRLGALGLEVQVTEADVRIRKPASQAEVRNQAAIYEQIVETCLEADNCSSVTLWGFTDRYSWIPGFFKGFGDAHIFDENYKPKLAYEGLLDGFQSDSSPNQPPAKVAPTIQTPSAVTISENGTAVLNINSTDDVDSEEDGLTYRLSGGADAALFSIDKNGVLNFKAAPDFEKPGDANGDNIYKVKVAVTDSDSLTATQNLSVTIKDVNESSEPNEPDNPSEPSKVAPTIKTSSSVTIAENKTAVLNINSTDDVDSEGDGLTYRLSGGADAALFSIDKNGVLNFKAAPDFEKPGDANGDNIYKVKVTVTDSDALTATQNLSVTVSDIADTPSNPDTPDPGNPGGGNSTLLDLGNGNNKIKLRRGNHTILAGAGHDKIGLGTGIDTVDAGDGNNFIYMTKHNGRSDGSKDILTGSGDDRVKAGSGDDRLNLGTAKKYDIAFGRGGSDTFVLNEGRGYLIIRDFEQGIDKIEIGSLSFDDLNQSTRNGKTWLSAGNDTLASLTSFTGSLTAEDFTTVG
ncbi:endo-1,4-beta-xylanase [Leptothoe sp. LEGE 181152]|nr:endo-1,4-beta-xylanase [Leptothoe sp. LEGE 181152]